MQYFQKGHISVVSEMAEKLSFEELKQKVRNLEKNLSDEKTANNVLREQLQAVEGRVKRLNCIYGISKLLERRYISTEQVLKRMPDLVSSAWQYPDIACTRIILEGKEFRTENFSETSWKHSAGIFVNGRQLGTLEVCMEERPEKEQGVFLKQETRLINSIAEQLGKFIDQRNTEELLKKYQDNLEIQMAEANDDLTREIEVRRFTEEALRESEEKHRIVLEAAPDPVAVYDIHGMVSYLNPAFTRVFGWTLRECVGRNTGFVPEEMLPETEIINNKISRSEPFSGIETYRLTKEGRKVYVSVSGAFFYDTDNQPMGRVLTFQDITDRRKTQDEITFIAYHDSLTGLPNRKSFYKCLEDKLHQSQRRVGDSNWALLFLDLDKFKYVNDTLGHDTGDELLKSVAVRLRDCLRKTDHIFRLGGDEFTIILENLFRGADVANVALKIRDSISRPFSIKGNELHSTVSIGISIYPNDGADVETLVKNADMAMYVAKEEDEGYRFFAEEMNRKAVERMKMGNSLRNALQHNQFVLHYQPLVDNMNKIAGMEALLRWDHPELGILTPEKFIPLAEETGTIVPIGEWVLESACSQAMEWHNMGYTWLYVTVNLSTRQFREKTVVDIIKKTLADTGLPPECLKLEVTESGIMENPEQAIAKMNLLRSRGIRFSIDDFGTGYSSLNYMKRFPIDTLKIDRSFVADSMTSQDDREIIRTIIAMANALNIKTVAEGVETREQIDFLRDHGCNIMQGYYFSQPMPAEKFEKMLQLGKFET
ncbi:MAG: EAL domain-containing protein [Desulfobacterales bacterium]|nr:EAL domain-containing protein [Desulfobacterales bacterium]